MRTKKQNPANKTGVVQSVRMTDGAQEVLADNGETHWMVGVCRIKGAKPGNRVSLTYSTGLWFGKILHEDKE